MTNDHDEQRLKDHDETRRKQPRRSDRKRTDDSHFAGVERIDADPEDIARALFAGDKKKRRR